MEALRQIERELERQGYLQRNDGQARAHPEGRAPARRDRAAPGLRRAGRGRLRRPRPARRRPGRRAHRRHPALAVRRRAGDRRRGDGAQRAAAGRRAGPAGRRRRVDPDRAEGDAAPRSGCRSTTSRSARPSGARRRPSACWSTCPTRWRCAAPGARRSRPRWRCTRWCSTRFPQDALQVIGFSNYARELQRDRPGRAGLGHGPGHQPAPRARAGRPLPRPAARAQPGRAGRHRRRADRAPAPGRQFLVRLAAVAGDPRAHPGRGGQDDQAPRRR